ncbi:uncharacterized protein LOC122650593 [Telopea speciosissima]|uniref:uncharacterized protein LOC122650593 n=1 Tax=Telopea speciosissima TaxID=54955 RepID=UPI001CC77880|nr:uncharacterized protein LOC122650593 [Telopea speciosissima]
MRTSQNENATWSQTNIDIFVNIMLSEVRKGNRTTSTFNKAGWRNIMEEFTKETGVKYSYQQIWNNMNKLRQDYSNFKKLLDTTGFGWNSLTRTATIDDDLIWDRHIHPELCMIFGDTYASGDGGMNKRTAFDHIEATETKGDAYESIDESNSADGMDVIPISQPEPTHTPARSQPQNHRHDRTPNTKRRKSRSSDWAMAIKAI